MSALAGVSANRMQRSTGELHETPAGRKVTFKLTNPK